MKSFSRYLFAFLLLLSFNLSATPTEVYYLSQSDIAAIGIIAKHLNSFQKSSMKELRKTFPIIPESFPTGLRIDQSIFASSNNPQMAKRVEVNSFEEFIDLYRGKPIHENKKLADLDVNVLTEAMKETIYFSRNPEVNKKIQSYLERRSNFLLSKYKNVILIFLEKIKKINLDDESLKNAVSRVIDQEIQMITDTLMKDTPENLSLLQQSTPDKDSDTDLVAAQLEILKVMLKSYYSNLPSELKAEMVYNLAQLPLQANLTDIFVVMIQNSGPIFQKFLQIAGSQQGVPESLKKLFKKLEDSVKQVHFDALRKLISEQGLNSLDFTYLSKNPLGVGSMAQNHIATMPRFSNKPGLLRFTKPNIERLVALDAKILMACAITLDEHPLRIKFGLPSAVKQMEDLVRTVQEEVSSNETVKKQQYARLIMETETSVLFDQQKHLIRFRVPRAEMISNKKDSKVLFQEKAPGKKFMDTFLEYKEIYPNLYRVVTENLVSLWLDQAFFKSGFFHADPHPGNLLMDVTEEAITVNIIDWGMAGQIGPETQDAAFLLGIGIEILNPELIYRSFLKLTKEKTENEALKQIIFSRVKYFKSNPQKIKELNKLEHWVLFLMQNDVDLDYEFKKLNRGIVALTGSLSESGSSQSMKSLLMKLAVKNVARVSKLLLAEKLLTQDDFKKLALIGLKVDADLTQESTRFISQLNQSRKNALKEQRNRRALSCSRVFSKK